MAAETKDDPKTETSTTTKESSEEWMTIPGHAPEIEVNEAPIERSEEVVEEPENDLDKGANDDYDEVVQEGNTVTECRKELEIAPGDVETKANDPPNERDAEVEKKKPGEKEHEGAEGAKQGGSCGAARDSLGEAGPQELARDQRSVGLRDSDLNHSQRRRHVEHHQSSLRGVRSPPRECFQRGAAEHRAWIGLVRATLAAPTLPEQVQAGLRAHRDGTNMSELTEGVKLVKTRKAWDKNTLKLLLCVSPNLHSQLVFLPAAIESCGGKLKRGVASRGGLGNSVQEQHLETLEN